MLQKYKISIEYKKIFLGLSTIFSISMVHYAGFRGEMPVNFLNAIPTTIAIDFTSVFIFYFSLTYAVSRALSIFFSSMIMILLSMFLRATHTYSVIENFKFSKLYIRMYRSEGILFILINIFIFYSSFTSLYLNFSITDLTKDQIEIAGYILIAGILRITILPLSPFVFFNRLKGKRRYSIYSNLWTNAFVTTAFLALPLSFLVGSKRMEHLTKLPPVYITSSQFSGEINILIKSNNSILGIDQSNGYNNYIYLDESHIITSKPRQDLKDKLQSNTSIQSTKSIK